MKKLILVGVVTGMGVLVLTFLFTSIGIGETVKGRCEKAKLKYGGDCVEVLAKTLDDESNSLRERNQSVWALGQLGDEKALETVKKYYTGNIPKKESYDKTLSQYEMKKAIKLLEGGFNTTAFVWRYNF